MSKQSYNTPNFIDVVDRARIEDKNGKEFIPILNDASEVFIRTSVTNTKFHITRRQIFELAVRSKVNFKVEKLPGVYFNMLIQ